MAEDYAQKIVQDVLSGIEDWENDMSEFFGNWNDWADAYRMKNKNKEKRPYGVAKNISGETTRAVNALASSITRMQTMQDPYFELRADGASEEDLYFYERKYQKMLLNLEFKRKLNKGNRGLCLFGTQIWEEPYMSFPVGVPQPWWQGTDFVPLSLIQVPFRPGVYDINYSDFIGSINEFTPSYLRFISQSPIWNREEIEDGVKEKEDSQTGNAKSSITARRTKAGYQEGKKQTNELILWHGRLQDYENPLIAEMWAKYGRTDDPRNSDITVGILNRKRLVRFHPTPYGTWHHMYKIGHFIEFELEAYAYGVGALGYSLHKDINRLLRNVNDVATFDLYSMKFAGAGANLKSNNLNVFPFAVIPAGDVNQIKEIRPNIEGIAAGLKLLEQTREDFRGVTHATSTLQAVLTGATATESSLAQSEALRAIGLTAEINADSVLRPHGRTMHLNEIDQNPFDEVYIRDLDFIWKCTTDKDYKPEHSKKLLEFLSVTTSIRSNMPLDFNPMPILKYMARSVGIDPRELKEPRPQLERVLDAMRRINGNSGLKDAVAGEVAGAGTGDGNVSDVNGPVPTAPGNFEVVQ